MSVQPSLSVDAAHAVPGTVTRHTYPLEILDLRPALRESLSVSGQCLLDEEAHTNPEIIKALQSNRAVVRSRVMEALAGSAFQARLTALSAFLCERHFGRAAYFQKLPSLRLFLPGDLGTSWHTDNWYGHGQASRTFWLPLTLVEPGAGVCFINKPAYLDEIEQAMSAEQIALETVNDRCTEQGAEWPCAPGQYLSFDARTLHGSVANDSRGFRISLDFRGCQLDQSLGNKPLNNYRVVDGNEAREAAPSYADVRAVKYINGASGASAKFQHILIESYAAEHQAALVRNEAEIESLPACPVLFAYASRKAPAADQYDALILYSTQCLPRDHRTRQRLLELCRANKVSLHFALEDLAFPQTIDYERCMANPATEPSGASPDDRADHEPSPEAGNKPLRA
ncbi:MAG: phytanoyl-CoA dioxygenase family protein [Burkholderiaceae bacterium]